MWAWPLQLCRLLTYTSVPHKIAMKVFIATQTTRRGTNLMFISNTTPCMEPSSCSLHQHNMQHMHDLWAARLGRAIPAHEGDWKHATYIERCVGASVEHERIGERHCFWRPIISCRQHSLVALELKIEQRVGWGFQPSSRKDYGDQKKTSQVAHLGMFAVTSDSCRERCVCAF